MAGTMGRSFLLSEPRKEVSFKTDSETLPGTSDLKTDFAN
jgi:hypothetical protein